MMIYICSLCGEKSKPSLDNTVPLEWWAFELSFRKPGFCGSKIVGVALHHVCKNCAREHKFFETMRTSKETPEEQIGELIRDIAYEAASEA